MPGGLVSPDGQFIFRADDAGQFAVYPISGGTARPIPGISPGFIPVQWSADNSFVYGYRPGQVPTEVYRINLRGGEMTLIQELQPETTMGVVAIAPVVLTRDASRFAYSYYQVFSVLYMISGLR
jgi:hypothetical protein